MAYFFKKTAYKSVFFGIQKVQIQEENLCVFYQKKVIFFVSKSALFLIKSDFFCVFFKKSMYQWLIILIFIKKNTKKTSYTLVIFKNGWNSKKQHIPLAKISDF